MDMWSAGTLTQLNGSYDGYINYTVFASMGFVYTIFVANLSM